MIVTQTSDGARVSILVQQPSAELATGILSGSFTVTVVAPDMTTTTTATMTESAKGGLYYFDVPSAFFAANGTGCYQAVVELFDQASLIFESRVLAINVVDDTYSKVSEIWTFEGLDTGSPKTATDTSVTVGGQVFSVAPSGSGYVLTRTS